MTITTTVRFREFVSKSINSIGSGFPINSLPLAK